MSKESVLDLLSWIHVDPQNLNVAEETIEDFLENSGAVDELGFRRWQLQIGGSLAPGVSTQHTRLRYMFFVPWAYMVAIKEIENPLENINRIEKYAREEILAERLVDAMENAGKGVIGSDQGKNLSLFPDQIYWNGLESFGFRESQVNRHDLYKEIERYIYGSTRSKNLSDEEREETDWPERRLWHPDLFETIKEAFPDDGWKPPNTFELRDIEIDFLLERLTDNQNYAESVILPAFRMARDVRNGFYGVEPEQNDESPLNSDYAWEFVRRVKEDNKYQYVSDELVDHVTTAERISEAIQGANIAYYWACAERANSHLESQDSDLRNKANTLKNEYRQAFKTWRELKSKDEIKESIEKFVRFRSTINKRIDSRTRSILKDVLERKLSWPLLRKLRETEIKAKSRERARLFQGNEEELCQWVKDQNNPENWKQHDNDKLKLDHIVQPMDFRWGQVRTFINDIHPKDSGNE